MWAIGGGQVCEEGKIVADHLRRKLWIVPTNLSCDAFFTSTIAVRNPAFPGYPEPQYAKVQLTRGIIFDAKILLEAEPRYNVAGWADILSGITAWITWSKKKNYSPVVAKKMEDLISRCCYPYCERNLKILYDTLDEEVILCNMFNSSDPEEGIEHKVAYRLEGLCLEPMLHGELVFIGIYEIVREFKEIGLQKVVKKHFRTLKVDIRKLERKIRGGRRQIKEIVKEVVDEFLRKGVS